MEEHFESHIEALFDLISSKPYATLTAEEKAFVDQRISPEEYELQRKVMMATEELNYPDALPLPLEQPVKATPILMRSIPLYQVLVGAACLLLGFFLFTGKGGEVRIGLIDEPIRFSISNSPQVVQVVHDTVDRIVPDLKSPIKIIRDTISIVRFEESNPHTRMLDARVPTMTVALNSDLLETKGKSSKEDNSTSVLPKTVTYSSMK